MMTFKNLIVQKMFANFNEIWIKVSIGEGNSSLFNVEPCPISMIFSCEIVKIY